eukprot:Rmarinus@m.16740
MWVLLLYIEFFLLCQRFGVGSMGGSEIWEICKPEFDREFLCRMVDMKVRHSVSMKDNYIINLRDSTLPAMDMSGLDFSQADFSKALLAKSNMQRCVLSCCHFNAADLRHADLRKADLSGAILTECNLQGCAIDGKSLSVARRDLMSKLDISNCMISGTVDLEGAVLCGSNFSHCSLTDSNFKDCDLTNVCFDSSDLSRADFTGVNMTGASFSNACMAECKLSGALLDRQIFESVKKDLHGLHASAMDLSDSHLDGFDFSRAVLRGASFLGASLKGTKFNNAVMSASTLKDAILDGTDFRGAVLDLINLPGASFSTALLKDAQFRSATLKGCVFLGTSLAGVNFESADLSGADLRGCQLQGTSFRQAICTNAQFDTDALSECVASQGRLASGEPLSASRMHGVTLSGCVLDGVKLDGAIMSGATLRNTSFRGASLRGIVLKGSDLRETDFSDADLTDADLSSCRVEGAVFTRAKLDRAMLTEVDLGNVGTDLRDISLVAVNLRGSNLAGYDLSGAQLRTAILDLANLTGANLTGSNLVGCSLISSTLTRATLAKANLTNALLTNANAVKVNFESAILRRCDMRFCDATDATFRGTRMADASFAGATLDGAIFEPSPEESHKFRKTAVSHPLETVHRELQRASFRGCNLSSINLSAFSLRGADLRTTNLKNAVLEETMLQGARMRGVQLEGASLKRAALDSADLTEAHAVNVNFCRATFEAAIVDRANFSRSTFLEDSDLTANEDTDIDTSTDRDRDTGKERVSEKERGSGSHGRTRQEGTSMVQSWGKSLPAVQRDHMAGVNLSYCVLRGIDLSGATMTDAVLTGSDLRFSHLRGTNFTGSDLTGASLVGAVLDAACLSRCRLKASDLRLAYMDRANLIHAQLEDTALGFPDIENMQLGFAKDLVVMYDVSEFLEGSDDDESSAGTGDGDGATAPEPEAVTSVEEPCEETTRPRADSSSSLSLSDDIALTASKPASSTAAGTSGNTPGPSGGSGGRAPSKRPPSDSGSDSLDEGQDTWEHTFTAANVEWKLGIECESGNVSVILSSAMTGWNRSWRLTVQILSENLLVKRSVQHYFFDTEPTLALYNLVRADQLESLANEDGKIRIELRLEGSLTEKRLINDHGAQPCGTPDCHGCRRAPYLMLQAMGSDASCVCPSPVLTTKTEAVKEVFEKLRTSTPTDATLEDAVKALCKLCVDPTTLINNGFTDLGANWLLRVRLLAEELSVASQARNQDSEVVYVIARAFAASASRLSKACRKAGTRIGETPAGGQQAGAPSTAELTGEQLAGALKALCAFASDLPVMGAICRGILLLCDPSSCTDTCAAEILTWIARKGGVSVLLETLASHRQHPGKKEVVRFLGRCLEFVRPDALAFEDKEAVCTKVSDVIAAHREDTAVVRDAFTVLRHLSKKLDCGCEIILGKPLRVILSSIQTHLSDPVIVLAACETLDAVRQGLGKYVFYLQGKGVETSMQAIIEAHGGNEAVVAAANCVLQYC